MHNKNPIFIYFYTQKKPAKVDRDKVFGFVQLLQKQSVLYME